MINRLSSKFYLNEAKKRADSKIPIYLRITVKRKKAEIALDQAIFKNEWDAARQRAKKDLRLNEDLNSIENKVSEGVRALEKDDQEIDARLLKDIVTGKEKVNVYLMDYFKSHLEYISKNPQLKEGTVSRYRDTCEHLSNFLKLEKKGADILIKRIDVKFVKDFELYLLNYFDPTRKKKLERNTVNKHLVRFKTIILKANTEGVLKENPFKAMKIKYSPSNRQFLTQEEINKILELDFSNNTTLEKVRDIFIWSCYTGLRFEDAQQLKVGDIKKEQDGKYYVSLLQQKTGELASIPLLSPAVGILKKYENAERKITGKILPQISNQKANVYLKHIATIAGIEKAVTTHVARHTCATTILLSNEAPMEIVSKWLGHNNIRTTQEYAKITNEYLKKTAEKVESKI